MGKTKVDPPSSETNALAGKATSPESSANQKNYSNLWCDHFNKLCHIRETCWKIHGISTHLKGSKSGPSSLELQHMRP